MHVWVELRGKYRITSNQESGYGRYDVVLELLREDYDAVNMTLHKKIKR